jgi:hypothetical protein
MRTTQQANKTEERIKVLSKELKEFRERTRIFGWGELTFCRVRFAQFKHSAYMNWYYHPADFPSDHTGYRNIESDNYGHAYSLHGRFNSATAFEMENGWEARDEYNHRESSEGSFILRGVFSKRGEKVYVSESTKARILKSRLQGILIWKKPRIDRYNPDGPKLEERGGIVE